MGCSRARHRADGGVCHSSVRQRTTANEPANHGPRFTPHCWLSRDTPRTTPTQAHPRWRPGGSAPQTPRDLSPLCQARREKQKRDAQRIPSPISAPESALGSHLRVALSSVQVTDHFICDRIAEPLAVRAAGPKRRPSPAVPAQRRAVRQSQIRFLGGHARSRTDGSACVLRDPRRSFFPNTPQISGPTPFPAESSATRSATRSAVNHETEKTKKFQRRPLTRRTLSGRGTGFADLLPSATGNFPWREFDSPRHE